MNETEAREAIGRLTVRRFPADPGSLDLKRFPVDNYIVFRQELEASAEDSLRKISELRRRLAEAGGESLFMADEEGGRVSQIAGWFPEAPSALALGRWAEPEETELIYHETGRFLRALGLDVNLFPCVDVCTEPLNPIVRTRAYGETPDRVCVSARTAVRAFRRWAACFAKHFPGHGMTGRDSHLARPVVELAREQMESSHLAAFPPANPIPVDGIMVGHCTYTALQTDDLPGSLSPEMVSGVLRRGLRYRGPVITDSLDMKAVGASAADLIRLAFEAGSDMPLFTESEGRFEEAFEAAVEDVVSGKIDSGTIRRALSRRNRLAERCRSLPRPEPAAPSADYLRARRRILDASLRIEGDKSVLPLDPEETAVMTTGRGAGEDLAAECYRGSGRGGSRSRRNILMWMDEPLRPHPPIEELRQIASRHERVIMVTNYPALRSRLPRIDLLITSDDATRDTLSRICGFLTGAGPLPGRGYS
jgi:beta-N-acetylhexosaminidase